MEKLRLILTEVLDAINNQRPMVGVMEALDTLNKKELERLKQILSLLTMKTKDEFIIGRIMMLRNQVDMTLNKQMIITQYK